MTKIEKITAQKIGVFAGESNTFYHSQKNIISKSGTDKLSKTPGHFDYTMNKEEKEQTASMVLGSLTHTLVFEPHKLEEEYAAPFVAPENAIRTVDDIKSRLKELDVKMTGVTKKDDLIALLRSSDPEAVFVDDLRAEWEENSKSKTIITEEQLEKAKAMAASVMRIPLVKQLIQPGKGEAELSCYWIDEETGVPCRVRPDWWGKNGVIADLKTTTDASEEGFQKSLDKWRYFVQDPFYIDGTTAAREQGGYEDLPAPKEFIFIAVESSEPHFAKVYFSDEETEMLGRLEYKSDLKKYAECFAKNEWPAYGDDPQEIGLSDWKKRQLKIKHGIEE